MKQDKLNIAFVIIFICIVSVIDVKATNLTSITTNKAEYSKALESAVDDAVFNLVEVDRNRKLSLSKENAIEQFYVSLYSNFGVLGDSLAEQKLKGYIPIILVTDRSGFYIYYSDKSNNGTETILKQNWTEMIPYTYEDEKYIYNFTLENYVSVFDKSTMALHEGIYTDIRSELNSDILNNDEKFNNTRKNTIINAMQKKMKHYINNHNLIAEEFGIQYNFWLPEIDTDDWYRTIDDISILVIFQGYPYGVTGETFNRYSLSAARIRKSIAYYITEIDGIKYYHNEDCMHLMNKEIKYYTREECALQGAYPCLDCFY